MTAALIIKMSDDCILLFHRIGRDSPDFSSDVVEGRSGLEGRAQDDRIDRKLRQTRHFNGGKDSKKTLKMLALAHYES